MKWLFAILTTWTLLSRPLSAQSIEQLLADGNSAYDQGTYSDAEKYYQEAISKDVNHQWPQAIYNLANALYQQKKFDEAALQFKQVQQLQVKENAEGIRSL
jgi:tetratricopeptide (TPR) repeat protein